MFVEIGRFNEFELDRNDILYAVPMELKPFFGSRSTNIAFLAELKHEENDKAKQK